MRKTILAVLLLLAATAKGQTKIDFDTEKEFTTVGVGYDKNNDGKLEGEEEFVMFRNGVTGKIRFRYDHFGTAGSSLKIYWQLADGEKTIMKRLSDITVMKLNTETGYTYAFTDKLGDKLLFIVVSDGMALPVFFETSLMAE